MATKPTTDTPAAQPVQTPGTSPAEAAPKPETLAICRITETGTMANGRILRAGAIIHLDGDVADALVKDGRAVILGRSKAPGQ